MKSYSATKIAGLCVLAAVASLSYSFAAEPTKSDTVTVPRAEWEKLQKDVAELKAERRPQVAETGRAPSRKEGKEIEVTPPREGIHPATGFYISLSSAYQAREDSKDTRIKTAAEFSDGWAANGAIGYRFKPGIRLEGEFSYQNNENQSFRNDGSTPFPGAGIADVPPGGKQRSQGNVGLYALMASVYYDIPLGRWKPYIGGGIGAYQSEINGFTSPALSSVGTVINTRSPWTFAYQLRAGIAYQLTQNLELFLGYRYFHGNDLFFHFEVPALPPSKQVQPLTVTGGVTNAGELGLRVFF